MSHTQEYISHNAMAYPRITRLPHAVSISFPPVTRAPMNTILVIRFSSFPQGSASASSLTSMTAWKTCLKGWFLTARMPFILKIVPARQHNVHRIAWNGATRNVLTGFILKFLKCKPIHAKSTNPILVFSGKRIAQCKIIL